VEQDARQVPASESFHTKHPARAVRELLPIADPRDPERNFMTIETLDELLIDELRDLYDAEKQLVKALPKIAKAANSPELKEAIESHLEQTKGHVARLEEVFSNLGVKGSGKSCPGMKGLVEEGSNCIDQDAEDDLKDALLIGAAQRVEHYEMAAYGTARTFAEQLGHDDVVELLQQTLDEEKAADEKLTEISMNLLENMEPRGESETVRAQPQPAAAKRSSGRTRTAGGR
jgi:ferritin-like metal-binding protein YciE